MRKRLRQRAAKRAFDQRNRQRLMLYNRVLAMREQLHMGPNDMDVAWNDFGSIIHHCMKWSHVAAFLPCRWPTCLTVARGSMCWCP